MIGSIKGTGQSVYPAPNRLSNHQQKLMQSVVLACSQHKVVIAFHLLRPRRATMNVSNWKQVSSRATRLPKPTEKQQISMSDNGPSLKIERTTDGLVFGRSHESTFDESNGGFSYQQLTFGLAWSWYENRK
jgi:hypothetical protein